MTTWVPRSWAQVLAFVAWLLVSGPRLAWNDVGATGDTKIQYAASADEATLTALNSLATSSTWLGGYESSTIDNTTNKYTDFAVTAKITVAGAGLSAGEIRLYLVAMLDDSNWPDVFDGTASAETVTSAEIRDAICKPLTGTVTTTTASRVYYFHVPSLVMLLGQVPAKFVIFITHSTGANLAASGNQLTVKGTYSNTA